MDLIKFFQTGGPFMYAILAVMALGLAIALERLIYLLSTQAKTNKVWKGITPMLKANDLERAELAVSRTNTPLARVLVYGFSRKKSSAKRELIESAMDEGIMEVVPELEQRTHYLATLANIATLLGLLGTIIGLIQAFTAVANADPAEKADMLSASISVAMNTTAFGLTAAIPLILIHSYLSTKTVRLVDNIEMAAVKCLNLMTDE
ncbi:MotA/TolQ/ExbB proton channel family protein [Teredinibacter franksiae]|jgi:outer membrane transport energization protein ExbB (TC 2.C.1.1.1)|uniref:MotA/TolQ/ExbB proton channel family protein n=1 Tax=Teredinibacter franksiae TaxID=2761453 RepID=UPI00162A8850|nr:MotA/TolQ/ExbB proton channel family protein [Teredinibacter franksiae]